MEPLAKLLLENLLTFQSPCLYYRGTKDYPMSTKRTVIISIPVEIEIPTTSDPSPMLEDIRRANLDSQNAFEMAIVARNFVAEAIGYSRREASVSNDDIKIDWAEE